MGVFRALRPGTVLGSATGSLVGALTDREVSPLAEEPLSWEETLEHSETLYASVPAVLWDETLTGPAVTTGYTDPGEELDRLVSREDWTVTDADVTLYHRDETLEHETWIEVETGTDTESMTDHIMYVGDIEYGIQQDEVRQYLDDPGGQQIDLETACRLMRETSDVEVQDAVVQHTSTAPITQTRTRELSSDDAAAYLEQCYNHEAPYEQSGEPVAAVYGDAGQYRVVVRTGSSQSVYRPAQPE